MSGEATKSKIISIVVPVYNEEKVLRKNILEILEYLKNNLDNYDWLIIISDNNSNDQTAIIAKELQARSDNIKYYFLNQKGKGLGVIKAWQAFPADINIFMDADLATDLGALPKLIESIEMGNDMAVGSRHLRGSEIKRPFVRKIISRILAFILRIYFGVKAHDTACGFKGVSRRVLNEIVPLVKNMSWTFDTELILLAEKGGYAIKEIAVVWQEHNFDGRKSRGSIFEMTFNYLKEFKRLKNSLKNK
jgi:glycosyltransferase involved in cell wall biosynthesis